MDSGTFESAHRSCDMSVDNKPDCRDCYQELREQIYAMNRQELDTSDMQKNVRKNFCAVCPGLLSETDIKRIQQVDDLDYLTKMRFQGYDGNDPKVWDSLRDQMHKAYQQVAEWDKQGRFVDPVVNALGEHLI